MPLSPVVESFLAGQAQAADSANKANESEMRKQDWQLKKQHIDELTRQFDLNHKLEMSRVEAENAYRAAQTDIAHQNLRLGIYKGVHSGEIPVSQTGGVPQQPIPGMQIPGMNMATPSVPVSSPPQNIPIGSPMTVDLGNGPITIPRPETEGEAKLNDLKNTMDAQNKAALEQQGMLLPGEISKYKQTIGDTKEQQIAKDLEVAGVKRDSANEVARVREEAGKYAADARQQSALLGAQMHFYNMMAQAVGPENVNTMMNPEAHDDLIRKTAMSLVMGEKNPTEVPAGLKGSVQTYLTKNGLSIPQGGTKFKADITTHATSTNRLLNDINNLNNDYPAGENWSGRQLRRGTALMPGSDIGQAFDIANQNIATQANMEGETPGMMRSPTMARWAASNKFGPADTPRNRNNKYVALTDFALTRLAGSLNSIKDPEIRKAYWQQIVSQLTTLKKDARFAPVLEKILKTGNFTSDMLNPLRQNAQ